MKESWRRLRRRRATAQSRQIRLKASIYQVTKSPTYPLQYLLPLCPVTVGAFDVLRDRNRIVRQPVVVDAVAVGISDLFIRRTIALDRSFVHVWLVLLLRGHRGHGRSPAEVAAVIIC